MRQFTLSVSILAISAASALAADLPLKASPIAPVAVYNWAGFYIGVNGGGGSARNCWDIVNSAGTPVNPPVTEGCQNATGLTVGEQVGYRLQAAQWVFGVEAQGNWANFKGSNLNQAALVGGSPVFNDANKVDAFGLFTGQIGYAFNNILLYAKGGAAVVDDKYSLPLTPTGATALGLGTVAGQTAAVASEIRWGGAAGAGVEFGFAPNWSVALEYDHLFMGRRDVSQSFVLPLTGPPSTQRIGQDVDLGTVRLNYSFGGPVLAKY